MHFNFLFTEGMVKMVAWVHYMANSLWLILQVNIFLVFFCSTSRIQWGVLWFVSQLISENIQTAVDIRSGSQKLPVGVFVLLPFGLTAEKNSSFLPMPSKWPQAYLDYIIITLLRLFVRERERCWYDEFWQANETRRGCY